MATLDRICKFIGRIELVISIAIIVTIVAVLGLEVASRYILNQPLVWSSDLATLLLVWLAFLGASVALRDNAHVGMEVLTSKLSPLGRDILGIISAVLVGGAVLVTGWVSWGTVQLQSTQYITTLGLARSFYTLPIIWAAASMALTTFLRIKDYGRKIQDAVNLRKGGGQGGINTVAR